jgi:hypothetical protein
VKETKLVPLGRMGAIEEVTRWIVAIADPGAAWVTVRCSRSMVG